MKNVIKVISIALAIGLLVLTGCSGSPAPATTAPTTTAPTTSTPTTTAPTTSAPTTSAPTTSAPTTTAPTTTTPTPTTTAPTTTAPTTTAPTTTAPTTTAPTTTAPTEPAVMTELGVVLDYITPEIATNQIVEIRVRTLPGATVFIQPVNPVTGTWSAWPKFNDGGKKKTAGDDGLVSWSWELYDSVAKGEGELIFLVTSNPDPAYTSNWKSNMTERDMNKFAKADDTIIVTMPWFVAKSDY